MVEIAIKIIFTKVNRIKKVIYKPIIIDKGTNIYYKNKGKYLASKCAFSEI